MKQLISLLSIAIAVCVAIVWTSQTKKTNSGNSALMKKFESICRKSPVPRSVNKHGDSTFYWIPESLYKGWVEFTVQKNGNEFVTIKWRSPINDNDWNTVTLKRNSVHGEFLGLGPDSEDVDSTFSEQHCFNVCKKMVE